MKFELHIQYNGNWILRSRLSMSGQPSLPPRGLLPTANPKQSPIVQVLGRQFIFQMHFSIKPYYQAFKDCQGSKSLSDDWPCSLLYLKCCFFALAIIRSRSRFSSFLVCKDFMWFALLFCVVGLWTFRLCIFSVFPCTFFFCKRVEFAFPGSFWPALSVCTLLVCSYVNIFVLPEPELIGIEKHHSVWFSHLTWNSQK